MFTLFTTVIIFLGSAAQAQDYSLLFNEHRMMEAISADAPARADFLNKLRSRDTSNYYKELYRTGSILYMPTKNLTFRHIHSDVWELQGLLEELAYDYHAAPAETRPDLRREMGDVARDIEALVADIRRLKLEHLEQSLIKHRAVLDRFERTQSNRAEHTVRKTIKGGGIQSRQITGNRR